MNEICHVSITIYDIPAELLHVFSEKILKPRYPGADQRSVQRFNAEGCRGTKAKRVIGHEHA